MRKEARRRAQRLAIVVHRQMLDVQRDHAARSLLVDDDGHRAPLDAVAKRDTAAAGEAGVREAFHMYGSYYSQSRATPVKQCLDLALDLLLRRDPECFFAMLPSRPMITDTGMPNSGPNASCTSSRPLPTSTG